MKSDEVLQLAEHALEAGDSARSVARAYVRKADRAGVLDQFVALLQEFDPGMVDDALLDFLLQARRNGRGRSGLVMLEDVEPERVRWLWQDRVPLGKLTLLDGDPDVGKSSVAIDLTARITTGAPMPDGTLPELDGPRGVVLLTAEDGLGDTIRPRLDAAGGDPSRVAVLKTVFAGDVERVPTVEDLEPIQEAIETVDAALVVVDPLTAFMGLDVNTHRDADVRRALAGLADLADATGVSVFCIRHLNKSGGGNPLYRGGGSIGLIAAARSGLIAARDPQDPDGTRRVLAVTKANLACRPPALSYRLEAADDVVRVAWEGETDHSAHDLLEIPTGDERTARDNAAEFLVAELSRGPRPVTELKEAAKDAGLSWRTIERAKRDLEITAEKDGFDGPWTWRLPRARGGEERQVAALGDQNGENPQNSGPSPKTANSNDQLAAFGEEDAPSDPHSCPGCGRRIGPTSDLCGKCKREGGTP